MLFVIFVSVVGFGFIALAIVRLSNDGGGDDSGGGGDGWWRGHGRGRGPRGPRPRGPEPTWWPEFERDFRTYVRAQGQGRGGGRELLTRAGRRS